MRLVIMMQPVSASQSQYQNIPTPLLELAAASGQPFKNYSVESAMIRKLDLEQRALAVAPEVSFRWTDDSKLGNE